MIIEATLTSHNALECFLHFVLKRENVIGQIVKGKKGPNGLPRIISYRIDIIVFLCELNIKFCSKIIL